jgi:hypothetical protein
MTVKSEGVCVIKQNRRNVVKGRKKVRFYADMDGTGGCSLKMLNEAEKMNDINKPREAV